LRRFARRPVPRFDWVGVITFLRTTEKWKPVVAEFYEATVEYVDPLMLTKKMLRDHLARSIEHVEVDAEGYAPQRFVDVSEIG
jgi:hypothetical protein